MKPKFSIVIPVHNEEKILKTQFEMLVSALESVTKKSHYEIVFVENGSSDKTAEILKRLKKTYKNIDVVTLKNPSYGEAVRAGLKAALYDIVFRFDIDFWSVVFIKTALKELREKDIVVGSKNLPQSYDQRLKIKRVLSHGVNRFLRLLFKVNFSDTHGLKAYHKESILPLLGQIVSPNHFFETELLIRAHFDKLKIKELPVNIIEIRKSRFPFYRRLIEVVWEFTKLFSVKKFLKKHGKNTQRRLWVSPSYR